MTAVAAHTAALELRRRPSLPWPARASGEQPTGLVTVELFLGGWVDISALGYVRYASGVQITRGQQNETSAPQPGSCSMTLDNTGGRFSPRNPLGPWYGLIGRNTPIRVSVQSGNARSYRFFGEVPSWPVTWDPTGTDVNVPIQAAGILRRLSQGDSPLQSPPRLFWGLAPAATAAAAYWPCEDGSTATQIASGIGGTPMRISGTPQLSNFTGIASSDALPVLASTSIRGTVPAYTPDPINGSMVVFMIAMASNGETAQVLCQITTSGTIQQWELYYTTATSGSMGLRGRLSDGTIGPDSGIFQTGVNGQNYLVTIELFGDSTSVSGDVQLMNLTTSATNGALTSTALTNIGRVTSIAMGPSGALQGTAVGHIAVRAWSDTINAGVFEAYTGYLGEPVSQRFPRLCTLAGIPYEIVGSTALGTVGTLMGPQHSGKLLDLIQECVDADSAILYELHDQLGLGLRTHNALNNQATSLTLDYAAANLAQVPTPLDDDANTRNDVTVTRLNGSSTRAQQLTGPLNVQNAPAGVGRYDTSVTVNIDTDADAGDRAYWRLHLGTVDEPRYPAIGVQLAHQSITSSPVLRQAILAITPADRVQVVNTPVWLPPDGIDQLVLGFTERIDQFTHAISWNTTPASPYKVAVLEDLVLGHCDTDGSTLTVGCTPTDTSVLVTTTDPTMPLWTTNGGDYPFDLAVGGERWTVTGIGALMNLNPLFATDVSGWDPSHGTIAWSTAVLYPGATGSALVTPDGVTATGGMVEHAASTAVTVGASYVAGCWIYAPVALTDARACLDWYDGSSVYLSTTGTSGTVPVPAGVWTWFQQTLVAPASAASLRVRVMHSGTPPASSAYYVWNARAWPLATANASPQTMTVTRSVNGVVKPQVQGTDVRLFQPMILGM